MPENVWVVLQREMEQQEEQEQAQTEDRHCAWHGDPPDENGSHGICEECAAGLVTRLHERRELAKGA